MEGGPATLGAEAVHRIRHTSKGRRCRQTDKICAIRPKTHHSLEGMSTMAVRPFHLLPPNRVRCGIGYRNPYAEQRTPAAMASLVRQSSRCWISLNLATRSRMNVGEDVVEDQQKAPKLDLIACLSGDLENRAQGCPARYR